MRYEESGDKMSERGRKEGVNVRGGGLNGLRGEEERVEGCS